MLDRAASRPDASHLHFKAAAILVPPGHRHVHEGRVGFNHDRHAIQHGRGFKDGKENHKMRIFLTP
jgi:hypothetical protein